MLIGHDGHEEVKGTMKGHAENVVTDAEADVDGLEVPDPGPGSRSSANGAF